MNNSILKKLTPHLIAHLAFILIISIYYAPVFSGKKLLQNDAIQSTGFLKESIDYGKKTNEEILWTNSMFSGMPSWRGYSTNVIRYFHYPVTNNIPVPIVLGYFAFLGFYILLLSIGANYWLSFLGSVAFAFSSFNIISIEAGHTNKVFDMALMAPVIGGIIFVYNKKYWIGAAITAIFLSIHIFYGHYQITYYLIIMVFFVGIYELIKNIRQKTIPHFAIGSAFLLLAALMAVGPNVSQIWTTQVYSKNTQRGGTELTLAKDNGNDKNTDQDEDKDSKGKGLDKDYTFDWSNGKIETMTIFIPSLYGGGSNESLSQNSDTYQALLDNNVPKSDAKNYIKNIPLYWGDQPFTSGPVYFGAIIFFLFVLGLFLVKDGMKWWVLAVTIFALLLSWGKNFEFFNDFFYYNFPLYNKFRSVTMTMAIAQLTFPFLAIAVLVKLSRQEVSYEDFLKGLKWSTIICAGLALLFALFGGLFFDFTNEEKDKELLKQIPEWMMDAIVSDRGNKLRSDAFRSLFFVLVAAGLLWAFVKEKIKPVVFYLSLSVAVLLDLTLVDKRYLNYDSFKSGKAMEREAFATTEADDMILQDKDPYYRVVNFTKSTFNDATTSYHHKSIGGYSAIKLGRYQDLITYQLNKQNMAVYGMLNTKYIIFPDQKTGAPLVQRNPGAMGNAWFVEDIKIVKNADEEMKAMDSTEFRSTAILDDDFSDGVKDLQFTKDSAASIALTDYHPNRLTYQSKTGSEQLAVFSEIYYQPGWNAYIDGKLTPHFRVNYVLRALRIPAGDHKIEFKFEPQHYFQTEKISLIGSVAFVAFLLLAIVMIVLQNKKEKTKTL